MMKIAVLLSTYNGEKYVGEQIKSIVEQDVQSEVFIYVRDDGSTDTTIECVKKYDNMISIIWGDSKQNLKSARSFWNLLETAPKADYYAFCDQDDYWHSDKLRRAVTYIENENNQLPILYFSNSVMVDADLHPIKASTYAGIPQLSIAAQCVCGACQGCTMVMNEKCRQMLLSKKIETIIMHDLTALLYTVTNGRVIYDEYASLDYRQHENNVESNANKSLISRVRQSYGRWIKGKNLMSQQIRELYDKCINSIEGDDKEFCKAVISYQLNFKSKKYLIKNANKYSDNKRAVRSFRIRVALNLY